MRQAAEAAELARTTGTDRDVVRSEAELSGWLDRLVTAKANIAKRDAATRRAADAVDGGAPGKSDAAAEDEPEDRAKSNDAATVKGSKPEGGALNVAKSGAAAADKEEVVTPANKTTTAGYESNGDVAMVTHTFFLLLLLYFFLFTHTHTHTPHTHHHPLVPHHVYSMCV